MSISLATGGMFNSCCGSNVAGGGAPPYRRDDERPKFTVLVKNVEMKNININESKDIKVRLVDDGGTD